MAGRRVVVVGAGFAGLRCARALDGRDFEVLLLDRRNYHLFTPFLYQVATALLNPSDIAYPLRMIFRRSPNVRFRETDVAGIDLQRKVVRSREGGEWPYDVLVLATGSRNNYFGKQALSQATLGMISLGEALRLRNRILSCLETAAGLVGSGDPVPWLTTVVVGGGATGVEYAGALRELLDLTLGRDYPELHPGMARVIVVEGQDRLLSAFHPRLGQYARRTLESRGIAVRTGALVREASADGVVLSSGERIPAHTVVWSAGVRPQDPLPDDGVARSASGRIAVDGCLRLEGHRDVYVIGDVASVDANGQELPMIAPVAMQEGRYVAERILDDGDEPFRYRDKGTMAVIGRNAAVAQVGPLRLRGFPGWLTWLAVHIFYLVGFRNRVMVVASWLWSYARRDRPIRLIVRSGDDALSARYTREQSPTQPPD